jgi:ankyrin repeat protein
MQIRWFDHWLKGSQNGVGKNSPVRIFVMGDNQWRDEESWPLARSKEKVFYMTSDGRANTPAGSGCLTETAVIESGTDRYEYDPSDPVLSPSGPLRNDGLFPSDQRRLAQRQDILVYQTEPLKERMEATGEPVVDLYAASSARDTDWFVRLIDVHPDGPAVDVSHGFLRARYRNGLDRPEFIKPGEVIKYVIPMRPTSNAFLPGHRIRLDITSSYFPGRDRNHNTAEDQYADATLVTAYQAIHHGGERATRITLPWVANPIKPAELVEEARPEPAKETKPKPVKEAKSEPVAEPEEQAYPLHQAATDGDIEQVKHLVSEGANINALGKEKDTPLCRAVKARQMETVRLLVEADADVNAGSPPPLYIAVDVNDITIAKHLITHGAQVNPLKKWILFKHIPSSSSTEMAQLFIDNGADINSGPWTVWHGAIEENRADIMRILLQNGMDINTVGLEGKTPLELALSWRKEDMAAFLLANGADIHRKLKNGLTLWFNAAVEGHTWIAELLLARGVNIDERDDVYEFTALHYAARFGQKEIAELLIQKGADIEAKDKWDYQPIHWAAYHNRPDVIELLIAKGADVNAKTSLDQTPLQLAEPRRNTAAIEVLRKHGAKE